MLLIFFEVLFYVLKEISRDMFKLSFSFLFSDILYLGSKRVTSLGSYLWGL